MKTRVILFLAISAIITLSFTVVTVTNKQDNSKGIVKDSSEEPLGGFTSDSEL